MLRRWLLLLALSAPVAAQPYGANWRNTPEPAGVRLDGGLAGRPLALRQRELV